MYWRTHFRPLPLSDIWSAPWHPQFLKYGLHSKELRLHIIFKKIPLEHRYSACRGIEIRLHQISRMYVWRSGLKGEIPFKLDIFSDLEDRLLRIHKTLFQTCIWISYLVERDLITQTEKSMENRWKCKILLLKESQSKFWKINLVSEQQNINSHQYNTLSSQLNADTQYRLQQLIYSFHAIRMTCRHKSSLWRGMNGKNKGRMTKKRFEWAAASWWHADWDLFSSDWPLRSRVLLLYMSRNFSWRMGPKATRNLTSPGTDRFSRKYCSNYLSWYVLSSIQCQSEKL